MYSFSYTLLFCTAALLTLAGTLSADVNGADPRLTGAPGDLDCTSCHSGRVNSNSGSVKILLEGAATYTPGVKQRVTVQVSDPAQRRWGFEFTARLASDLTNGQAGDIATIDTTARVICETGRAKPCPATRPVQFITHTQAGTRLGTTGSVNFAFDWTPPSTNAGNIVLYAAGNAANGDNTNNGDHIYTTSVELTPAVAAPSDKPAISGDRGVVSSASFTSPISPNSWVSIAGTNLSNSTRTWTGAELASGQLPTSLDGVSVTINGKAAYVEYVSPTLVNVLAPADDSTGPVEVKVTAANQTSDPVMATLHGFAPAFFTFDGKYVAGTHTDNSLLGKPGLLTAAPTATTPAKPGETIVLYGTGFGPTSPSIPAGQLTTQVAPLTNTLSVTVGGQPATVVFAGLVPPYAQLYMFQVTLPSSVADGDQAVVAQIGGASSPATTMVTVQQ